MAKELVREARQPEKLFGLGQRSKNKRGIARNCCTNFLKFRLMITAG